MEKHEQGEDRPRGIEHRDQPIAGVADTGAEIVKQRAADPAENGGHNQEKHRLGASVGCASHRRKIELGPALR